MFVEKLLERISKVKYLKCSIKDGQIFVLHNGICKFEIMQNGVIRRLNVSNDDIFYMLFDIVSKLRADLICHECYTE